MLLGVSFMHFNAARPVLLQQSPPAEGWDVRSRKYIGILSVLVVG
jgi:hypothetical protein